MTDPGSGKAQPRRRRTGTLQRAPTQAQAAESTLPGEQGGQQDNLAKACDQSSPAASQGAVQTRRRGKGGGGAAAGENSHPPAGDDRQPLPGGGASALTGVRARCNVPQPILAPPTSLAEAQPCPASPAAQALAEYASVLTPEEQHEAIHWQEGSLKLDISVFRVHLKRMLRLAAGIQTMSEMIRFMNAYGATLLRISQLLADEQKRGMNLNQLNGEINAILKEILEVMEDEQEQHLNGTSNGK